MDDSHYSAEELRGEIESEMRRLVEEKSPVEPLVFAIKHSLFPAGKLIRPLLALSFCLDFSGNYKKLLPVAASLELLHTSSLIHDDLPAMDDDDMRRGRPSCHKLFGEATAILAGDYLVGLAHHVLTDNKYSPDVQIQFVQVLSETYLKLCDGQQLDLVGSDHKESILKIHSLKTAALFSATMAFGAIGAGLMREVIATSSDLGAKLGLSFQIIDDYLDRYGTEKGRKAGSDEKNHKTTFLNVESESELKVTILNRKEELYNLLSKIAVMQGLNKDPSFSFPQTWPIIESVFNKI